MRHLVKAEVEAAQRSACQANVRQLAMAMLMYAADYDERLPAVERWPSVLDPYTRVPLLLVCPAAPHLPCGYAMREALSGACLRTVNDPQSTPMLFETEPGTPGSSSAVAYRHGGGSHFAFVDGHVAWVGADSAPILLADTRWRHASPASLNKGPRF